MSPSQNNFSYSLSTERPRVYFFFMPCFCSTQRLGISKSEAKGGDSSLQNSIECSVSSPSLNSLVSSLPYILLSFFPLSFSLHPSCTSQGRGVVGGGGGGGGPDYSLSCPCQGSKYFKKLRQAKNTSPAATFSSLSPSLLVLELENKRSSSNKGMCWL